MPCADSRLSLCGFCRARHRAHAVCAQLALHRGHAARIRSRRGCASLRCRSDPGIFHSSEQTGHDTVRVFIRLLWHLQILCGKAAQRHPSGHNKSSLFCRCPLHWTSRLQKAAARKHPSSGLPCMDPHHRRHPDDACLRLYLHALHQFLSEAHTPQRRRQHEAELELTRTPLHHHRRDLSSRRFRVPRHFRALR